MSERNGEIIGGTLNDMNMNKIRKIDPLRNSKHTMDKHCN